MRISTPPPEASNSNTATMLDIVYIIEEKFEHTTSPQNESSNEQNFTMPGRDIHGSITASPLGALSAISPFLFPVGLIANAVSTSPAIVSMFKDSAGTNAKEADSAKLALAAYVAHHSMAKTQAKSRGYSFQPGHPVVGKAYRRHPLADYPGTETGNLYIPNDSYDSILLEERESELLKLLVNLGATRITITKKTSSNIQSSLAIGLAVDAGPIAGGGLNAALNSQKERNALDTREFLLAGKRWNNGGKLDRESFFWLPYEPSWKAVVFAREQGGCLTASLEIKESTSFSSDKSIELAVKAKMAEVNGNVGVSNSKVEEKVYLVQAEFLPLTDIT